MNTTISSKRARTAQSDTCNGAKNKCNGGKKRICIGNSGDCNKIMGLNARLSSSSATSSLLSPRITPPSNFPLQEIQHHQEDHSHQQQQQHALHQPRKECAAAICRTFLWLYVCFLVTGGTLAVDPKNSPSSCQYPDPVEFAFVKPLSSSRGGFYPNGSKAHVDCYSNFRVRYGDPSLICLNGEWTSVSGRPVECELIHSIGATRCGAYPEILQGYYIPLPEDPMTSGSNTGNREDGYPVGTELQADCVSTYTLNCTHPHRHLCGRIVCMSDERWVPKDGVLVTACVAKPVVHAVNGDDDRHGQRSSSSLKNYLVLALVLVCIFVVGALTVALLRRPLFCKKREQNQGDGPVVIGGTSASPNHQAYGSDLDSLPVAMNTGIFLPGQGYDLQDCQIQDVPFVGTTVFK